MSDPPFLLKFVLRLTLPISNNDFDQWIYSDVTVRAGENVH